VHISFPFRRRSIGTALAGGGPDRLVSHGWLEGVALDLWVSGVGVWVRRAGCWSALDVGAVRGL
jgi:hypothetical protein